MAQESRGPGNGHKSDIAAVIGHALEAGEVVHFDCRTEGPGNRDLKITLVARHESALATIVPAGDCSCTACEIVRGELATASAFVVLDARQEAPGELPAFVLNSEGDAI